MDNRVRGTFTRAQMGPSERLMHDIADELERREKRRKERNALLKDLFKVLWVITYRILGSTLLIKMATDVIHSEWMHSAPRISWHTAFALGAILASLVFVNNYNIKATKRN